MMKTTMINKKRFLLAVRTTLKSGAALLLVILLLGMLGLWSLIPALLVMAVFLSLSVLLFLTMRDFTFIPVYPIFTFIPVYPIFTFIPIYPIYGMRDNLLDSYSSHTPEEDFTPFVFKD